MKQLALMAMIAAVMLVSNARQATAAPQTEIRGLGVGSDERVTGASSVAIDSRIERGDGVSRLVAIGQHRKMHLKCAGTGSPTVVLISGFRGAYDDWTHVVDGGNPAAQPVASGSAVFPEVSKFTRVCGYDLSLIHI